MSDLLALDVAILPPPEVGRQAMRMSAALPAAESQGLRLDAEHLPHITLTQQFVRVDEIDAIFERADEVLRGQPPLAIHVRGAEKSGGGVWLAIERTRAIAELHERLMEAFHRFEQPVGESAAFYEGHPRAADEAWVTGYRINASLSAYSPHITLGHATVPPRVDPFTFEASIVAACHLGRFCTCRRVLRSWTLG